VNEETEKKCGKLQNASDVQTGLEILHYFILDLLGRSGTIFSSLLLSSPSVPLPSHPLLDVHSEILQWLVFS
jgi:hypothetical protein